MPRTGFAALTIVLAAALVLAAGCSKGSSDKKAKEFAEEQMSKVLSQGGGGEAKVDLGSKGNVDLSGLPEDLRCPGTVAMAHIGGRGQDEQGDTYIFQAEGSPAEVAAFYKKSLAGWSQVNTMESPKMIMLGFDSPDGAKHVGVVVGAEQQSGKTNLSVTLANK